MNEPRDHEEWEILYNAIREVCAKHGKDGPFGEGDYWLNDDNWGGVSQTLLVLSPRFLTPKLVQELAQCIDRTRMHGAQILVGLRFKVAGKEVPPVAMVIGSDGPAEYWDLELLRNLIGQDFYTDR